jgi:Kdo2-lipid IVA lauroyltransferase/acyltransferase
LSKPLVQHTFELLSHASLRTLYRLGDVMAFLLGNTPNQVTRQARQNLALCFPDLEPKAQRRLYRQAMRHTCYSLLEVAAVWHWPHDKIEARITRLDVCDSFKDCKRGRIILAPHLGSWETLAVWLGSQINSMFLYKRRKNKAVDAYVKQARSRSGGIPLPTKKPGLRQALIGLRNGGSLMILPDQKPSHNKASIASSFFGLDAPTTTLVHSLCSKLDCELFMAVAYRSSPAGEFSLQIEPLDRAQLATDEQQSASYMNREIEQRIRSCPEQYQWGYRRFSNRVYESANQE